MSVSAYFTIEPSDSNNEPNDTTVTIIRLCDNTAVINADDTSSTPTTTGTFVLDDGAGDESDNTVSYNLATKVVNDSKNVLANSDEVGDEDTSNLDASVSASVVLVNKNLSSVGRANSVSSSSSHYCHYSGHTVFRIFINVEQLFGK
ncbi:unnamed protein product [Toxocara canis]|uniref:Cadherin domain-containing protein n=1 Tax=Toxocara canis TaxID=6265 RepID=A0A183UMA0_TOXCA|nr:unnamed protein product [Toxocara canis]